MTRRAARIALLAAVAAGVALAAAATRWSLLLLDAAPEHALLVVRRDAAIGMRAVDSACRLCARQKAGSPLHSALLPPSFCPLALATGPWVAEERVWLRLRLPPGAMSRQEGERCASGDAPSGAGRPS